MKTFIIGVGLLLLLICKSAFSSDLGVIVNDYNFPFNDSFVGTFWGSCQAPTARFDKNLIQENHTSVASTYFKKKLPVDEFIYKDAETIARPLVIVNPGIFTDLAHNHGRLLSQRAVETGSNVILIPNALGVEFLSALPNFRPGNVDLEGSALLDIIYKKVDEFRARNIQISKVMVMGVSYGSFLSAVATAKDKAEKNLIEKVLIFNPPLDMDKGLRNLDKAVDDSEKYYHFMGQTFNALDAYRYCHNTDESKFSAKDLAKIKSITSHLGFHSWLVKSINLLRKNDPSLNEIPSSKLGFFSPKYRKWRKNIRFADFIQYINPEASEMIKGDKGKLAWWLDQVPAEEVFVLSAKNDFLVENVMRPDRPWYYEISKGGHFGIQATSWFGDLFKELVQNH